MVREDELVEEIPFLVGPTLFNLDIFTLRAFNHIAPVGFFLHTDLFVIFSYILGTVY
jgi:hypothetical protein